MVKATRKTDALSWLRSECLSLPNMEEKFAWGHPTFSIHGNTIAAFEVFHGRPSIAVLAKRDYQEFLVKKFGLFKTPYSGRYGWVSAWVDEPVPWTLIRSLLREAYKSASAKSLSPARRRSGSPKRSRKPVAHFKRRKD